jgi:hypothetical protein
MNFTKWKPTKFCVCLKAKIEAVKTAKDKFFFGDMKPDGHAARFFTYPNHGCGFSRRTTTMNENTQETTQTIGNMRFVVVSQFQESGSTVSDKLKRLLEREVQEKIQNRTLDGAGQTE